MDWRKRGGRFAVSDLRWAIKKIHDTILKVHYLPLMRIPTKTADVYACVEVEQNVAIPMRDGVKLYANIYKPKAAGTFPVVLTRLPYGKDEYYCFMPAIGTYWAKKGYICVVQDVRGKWNSEGEWYPLVHEAEDGYDTLNWIVNQAWCNGNIGMFGVSYFGYTQWAVAPLNHPNLKCIAPGTITTDIYKWMYTNGAFRMQTAATWIYSMNSKTQRNYFPLNYWHLPLITMDDEAGVDYDYYNDVITHQSRHRFWDRLKIDEKYRQITIPVLHWGGWYDNFVKFTIDDWLQVREHAPARQNQWLVIGPIDHAWSTESTRRIGKLDIGEHGCHWIWDLHQQFFDYWLKGIDNGFSETPRVNIFVLGDNTWRYEHEWPLARTQYTQYYFHSNGSANTVHGDGVLDTDKPKDESSDRYIYDPNHPITISLETDCCKLAKELKDRTSVEQRTDVLVYTTSELEEDMEITGPLSVTLYAASSARDTDFTATLVDVFPDGYTHMIQEGIVRARYRNADRDVSLIEPGKIYKYAIDLWATSYVAKKGHKIRVEISSSNFNRYDRNPNTGNVFGMDTELVKATQTIYHDANRPSHISLPIIPR
ncbi:MAG: CocE/NonD family hydrolase [Candidatus Bathyarchaeota archaeon]|nr:MAG: CocE/NonD family hydrolase [Candidatus Bathyarchaeota archaeon]